MDKAKQLQNKLVMNMGKSVNLPLSFEDMESLVEILEEHSKLKDYLLLQNPFILKCFEREQVNTWENLKVGDKVMALRSGFGGGPGKLLTVKSKDKEDGEGSARLIDNKDQDYILYKQDNHHSGSGNWNCAVFLFTDKQYAEYTSLESFKDQEKWELANVGIIWR